MPCLGYTCKLIFSGKSVTLLVLITSVLVLLLLDLLYQAKKWALLFSYARGFVNDFLLFLPAHHDNPTTNTSPLTTHLALNVCGALRHQCSFDDDKDGKEDDCAPDAVFTSDQFSWKQWRKATILALKRQKPLTNALDGMYLPLKVVLTH